MCRILIVDNDQPAASHLGKLLADRGFHPDIASNAAQAQQLVTTNLYHLVITDADLSMAADNGSDHCDGYELLQRLGIMQPGLPVLLISKQVDTAKAIRAVKMGAIDYLTKPLDKTLLLNCINSVTSTVDPENRLIAAAPSSLHTLQLARKVAGTATSVLITGESGTGKEVLSRFIHDHSPRAAGPFVAVNCAAIPESMLESILFGHEKGSFTGATSRREGKFEQANGGTLFLDEVTEMPLAQQAKLLRVLQEREVDRLGGSVPVKLDVRVLSASNRDLHQQVLNGSFRADLYYRLNVFPLHWAPLRERREDIIPLANALLRRLAREQKTALATLSPEAEACLLRHHWPGNVRELDNVLQRAVVMSYNGMIKPADLMIEPVRAMIDSLPAEISPQVVISDEIDRLPGAGRKKAELQHLIQCLCEHRGHRSKTAAALGISTRMLRYKLARLREMGINTDRLNFDESPPVRASTHEFGSFINNHNDNHIYA